ncbi:MAG TPA: S9 family peptidase [Caulobacterales bacterium]|nr:S9 family peptidase [Caulobacterales bacterium]
MPPPAAAPIIARADLFGDAVRQKAQLSPNGEMIAFLAPKDGTLNVWMMPANAPDQARPVTDDHERGVRRFVWAEDNATILYLQDEQSDENWRLYAAPIAGGEARPLTPENSRADILGLSPRDPGSVVVTLNTRDAAWPDVVRIDIATGARTTLVRNTNTAAQRGFADFVVDQDNDVRLGLRSRDDGGVDVFARSSGRWSKLFNIPFEDAMASYPLEFASDGKSFLMLDSTGRDRAALVRVDAATGAKTVLGESQRADVVDAWFDPTTHDPEAFVADYLRPEWRALDPEAQADLDFLDNQLQGEPSVVSRSLDNKHWIVVEDGPTTPARSYLYDRSDLAARRLTLLFRHRPNLERAPLQPMTPVEIEARDGLTLVSYLTLPPGADANGDSRPEHPAPLVLIPHGGPWYRDSYGFNAMHQWLANRGYAVLSVNFRGSTGFGKAFLNAGNGEWGGKMQEDLLDAVQWAVEQGIAQPNRVAIMGGSYGGYAALVGLTATPDRFACGVSFAGVANLSTMLDSIPAYWTTWRGELYRRVGDPRTAEGARLLHDRSPLFRAAQIRAPLLLAMGGRDRFTSRAEQDVIAQSARARRNGSIYLNYPDEGHGLARPENRVSFFAISEQFLGGCLDGRVEPIGAALQGANVQAIDGADRVPGLSAFRRAASAAPPAAETTTEAVVEDAAETTTAPVPEPVAPPPASGPAPGNN